MIHVNDVNDNPPVFDRPTYETQITEEDDRNLPKRVLQVENTANYDPVVVVKQDPSKISVARFTLLCYIADPSPCLV